MRIRHAAVAAFITLAAFAHPARAELLITIDKSAQRMTVALFGDTLYEWPVSTGMQSYDTPSGEYKPFRMERTHFSREWDDAPMPHSIFFSQTGHAIHGSYHVKALGTPASHGCVRLAPANARTLFALVRQERMKNTRVILTGETPASPEPPLVASREGGDYERNYTTDEEDAAAPRRRQRSARWREYNDGPRYFYYRERPRYYFPPPPPFFFFGR